MGFSYDRIYIVSKQVSNGSATMSLLGDTQIGSDGFNISLVIDGTKDSCKIVVCSYSQAQTIEPQTIVFHPNTSTWWVVSNDKVERYINESGYYYIHHLDLLGAIELLNARDLTDCGFNNDRYSVDDFIKRLFTLSTFEYGITIEYNGLIDEDMVIDYLKTFENYTLLSALTEFLDGYNLAAKLTFNHNGTTNVSGAKLEIISKSGSGTPIDIETFNDVRQITAQNKNSFGTTVVSNAENVISTQTKIFPLVGGVKVSADEFEINANNCFIRLPSKVYEVKSVSMYSETTNFEYKKGNTFKASAQYDPQDIKSIDSAFTTIYNAMLLEDENVAADFLSQETTIKGQMSSYPFVKFYTGNNYDPIDNSFSSDSPRPAFRNWQNRDKEYVLGAKTLRNGVQDQNQVMYYEKGSDKISGFSFFLSHSLIGSTAPTLGCISTPSLKVFENNTDRVYIGTSASNLPDPTPYLSFFLPRTRFVIEYVPMSDLKVKVDNSSISKDIQLYNQNGRLTDSNAFSKLLLGYSKEIESATITKYMRYYGFVNKVAKVGNLVSNGNDMYVINNISYQLYLNENAPSNNTTTYDYYVEAEITMSKNVATKSLLTNPNTNIRDYGIPQTNNVKRKQLYRDFYEFSKEIDSDSDSDYYLSFKDILNVSDGKTEYQDHKAVIKCDSYYYQLDTTVYVLKKSIYEIVDFQDNNIIGYDLQNKYSGFDITRVFDNNLVMTNTPISYVDDIGEVGNITIHMCDKDQYSYVLQQMNATEGYKLAYHCFVNKDLYDLATIHSDFSMVETTYNKDALEVPVFEYSAQFDDSDSVIIGDNILKQDYKIDTITNVGFIYTWIALNKGTTNQNNALAYAPTPSYYTKDGSGGIGYNGDSSSGCCIMTTLSTYNDRFDILLLKELFKANDGTESTTNTTYNLNTDGKDILIFRTPVYRVLNAYAVNTDQTELMFILRNVKDFSHSNTTKIISVKVNHYKVK